jgi:two-component system response regulator LytT
MLKAFIVDDEPLARDELAYLLKRSRKAEVIGETDCFEDAVEKIKELAPDVVFLDIELTEKSGLDLANKLQSFSKIPAIIFATAYDEYALQAFDLSASDYVLKPFEEARIHQALDKLVKNYAARDLIVEEPPPHSLKNSGKIAVLEEERIILLDFKEIIYIGALDGKTIVKTFNDQFVTSETLVSLEKKATAFSFIRVHRSYLVNFQHIVEIQPWFNSTYNLLMKEHSTIPVSRTYVRQLRELLDF